MPVKPVISNNTPLVALWNLQGLTWLRDLYGEVIIPPAVKAEFLAIQTAPRELALKQAPWIKVIPLTKPRHVLLYAGLD